jgi:bisphosphoglycerate-dependent phosphoglycerate mutase
MKTPVLDQLLLGPQKIELPSFTDEPIYVWVRRLTQVERDLCTAAARRASRDMRRVLENKESEERQLLVEDEISEYDLEAMRAAWVTARLTRRAMKIYKQSLEDRDQTYIPEPEGDDVMPADIEQWENAVEDTEADREKNVVTAIESAQRQLNKEVEEISLEELQDVSIPTLIDTICSDIWTNEYTAQMICRGTFKDADAIKPAFKTAQEVKRLLPKAMAELSKAHMGLLVDPEAVKNSEGNQK